MYKTEAMEMSFSFGDINPPMKAQAAYKDGGGMGGGGMYFQQKKKRKDEPEDDIFQKKEDRDDSVFSVEFPEEDIPQDSLFNKFVNWFRINKE